MSRIVRYEFFGSWWVFTLLSMTGLLLPLAILHAITSTIRIEEELEDPERFVDEFRAGRLKKR